MKKSGIYKITNLVNNKIYVGLSKNLDKRWKTHSNELRKNKHYNTYLQSSWNKYKEENFKFDILEVCGNEELVKRENYWINFYESFIPSKGYNITHENYKIVERVKKNTKNKVCNRIYQIDANNQLVNIFESVSDAALHINIDAHQLGKKIWGNKTGKDYCVISYKGYCWVKEIDYVEGKEFYTRPRIRTPKINVVVLNKDGVVGKYSNKDTCKIFNISGDCLASKLKSNRKDDNGFVYVYIKDYVEDFNYFEETLYRFINKNTGQIIEMKSIWGECKQYRLNGNRLYDLIKGRKKNKKGEYIKYTNYLGWEFIK